MIWFVFNWSIGTLQSSPHTQMLVCWHSNYSYIIFTSSTLASVHYKNIVFFFHCRKQFEAKNSRIKAVAGNQKLGKIQNIHSLNNCTFSEALSLSRIRWKLRLDDFGAEFNIWFVSLIGWAFKAGPPLDLWHFPCHLFGTNKSRLPFTDVATSSMYRFQIVMKVELLVISAFPGLCGP